MSDRQFRAAMARVPAGIVVVSARSGADYRGLTASSLVSISIEPPMVLVGLERDSATRNAVVDSGAFNVNVLTRAQEFIADRLSGRAPALDAAWNDLPHRLGTNGIPLLDGCAAWLECRLIQAQPAGDHDICIGAVEAATVGEGDPLVLWDRAFWTLR